jgi:O-antigen ligase
MHLTAEDIVVEIVDATGPAGAARQPGEIVVTHLATRDFPFIRYRTGDVAVLDTAACACGRGLPMLQGDPGPHHRLRRRGRRHRDARPGADLHAARPALTIAKGGVHRVQGPMGTFIAGNNELALAMVMTIPLMYYLYMHEKHRWLKPGLMVAMVLTAISAFGTQSRGALVALTLTGALFWLKSRNKVLSLVLVVCAGLIGLSLMPPEWFERMNTIKTYDEDESALGRINAWWTAWHMANDRIVGGGFETWIPSVFARYAPDPTNVRDVHSIYFEVLGEHGWPGLILFLTLLALTWMKCNSIIRFGKEHPEAQWAKDLAAMIQVTMVAYMSAGAFLGLAYFDYIYHLIAITVVVHSLVVGQSNEKSLPADQTRKSQTTSAEVDRARLGSANSNASLPFDGR